MDLKTTRIMVKKKFKDFKFRDPILVAGFPGIGNVGRLVVEHIKFQFKPELIATLYSKHLPHVVFMLDNGTFRIVGDRFYLIRDKHLKNDIILLVGDAQPQTSEAQYEINRRIIKFFKERLKGKTVYSIAGHESSREAEETPRVYANATSKEFIAKLKGYPIEFGKASGMIFGSAAMLMLYAKLYGLDGACIMGEVSKLLDFDAMASKEVLKAMAKLLALKIDIKNINQLIDETMKALKELEKSSNPQEITYPSFEKHPSYIR